MAENHRSSTLLPSPSPLPARLGMAENHRSSTLSTGRYRASPGWGWPRITAQVHCPQAQSIRLAGWGWPRITAQVH